MTGAPDTKPETTPAIEWAVGALGGAALAAMIGCLVWEGLAGTEGPPEILLTAQAAPGGHLVPFVARNAGGSTAAAVRIEGALIDRGETVETSAVEIDLLPKGGERRGGLFFARDPASLRLVLRAEGFAEP